MEEEGEGKKVVQKADLSKHQVQVVSSLMSLNQETEAIEVCALAVELHKNTKDMATYVKKEYEQRFPRSGKAVEGVFHVVCGSHFGASISHETRNYVHLRIDLFHFIIFKSKDSPFEVNE